MARQRFCPVLLIGAGLLAALLISGCSAIGLVAGAIIDDHIGAVKLARLERIPVGHPIWIERTDGRILPGRFAGLDTTQTLDSGGATAMRVRIRVDDHGRVNAVARDSVRWVQQRENRSKLALMTDGAAVDAAVVFIVLRSTTTIEPAWATTRATRGR